MGGGWGRGGSGVSHHSLPPVARHRVAKVGELQASPGAEQGVGGLDVQVDHPVGVEVGERLCISAPPATTGADAIAHHVYITCARTCRESA